MNLSEYIAAVNQATNDARQEMSAALCEHKERVRAIQMSYERLVAEAQEAFMGSSAPFPTRCTGAWRWWSGAWRTASGQDCEPVPGEPLSDHAAIARLKGDR